MMSIAFAGQDRMLGPEVLFKIRKPKDMYVLPAWNIERARIVAAIPEMPEVISAIIADYTGSQYLDALRRIGIDYYECEKCSAYVNHAKCSTMSIIVANLMEGPNGSYQSRCRLVRKFVVAIAESIKYPEPLHPMDRNVMIGLHGLVKVINRAFDDIYQDCDRDEALELTAKGWLSLKNAFYTILLLVWPRNLGSAPPE